MAAVAMSECDFIVKHGTYEQAIAAGKTMDAWMDWIEVLEAQP